MHTKKSSKAPLSPWVSWLGLLIFCCLALIFYFNRFWTFALVNVASVLLANGVNQQSQSQNPSFFDFTTVHDQCPGIFENNSFTHSVLISPMVSLSGTLDQSELSLLQASELCSDCIAPKRNLALISIVNGELLKAKEILQEIVNLNPKDQLAWKYLGDAQVGLGNWAAALDAYDRSNLIDINLTRLRSIGNRSEAKIFRNRGIELVNLAIAAAGDEQESLDFIQEPLLSKSILPTAKALDSPQSIASLLYYQGNAYLREQNAAQALSKYRSALLYMPGLVYCNLFRDSYQEALGGSVMPAESEQKDSPEYLVQQEVGEHTLLAYNLNEEQLRQGGTIETTFFWSPEAVDTRDCEIKNIDNQAYCIETIETVNLFANGSFEWTPTCVACNTEEAGYNRHMYGEPNESSSIRSTLRDQEQTNVLAIENSQDYQRSGLAFHTFQVERNQYYLQAGWLRSEAGKAWFGHRWYREQPGERDYEFVVSDIVSDSWTHYTAVFQAPKDATTAEVWLLNYDSTGSVYFDDMIFVPISGLSGENP